MALAGEGWTPIGAEVVVAEFLRGERYRFEGGGFEAALAIIDHPSLGSSEENRRRCVALWHIREGLVEYVPAADTTWYRVEVLRDEHLPELHVINDEGWTDPRDRNELELVARRASAKAGPLRKAPREWAAPILFGRGFAGPFTILEGNKRLVAYVSAGCPGPMEIPVIVGLSRRPCRWYIE